MTPDDGSDAPATRADLERLAAGVGRRRPVERQRLHRLTAKGVERAREFLADLRENPGKDREPPHELLYDTHTHTHEQYLKQRKPGSHTNIYIYTFAWLICIWSSS